MTKENYALIYEKYIQELSRLKDRYKHETLSVRLLQVYASTVTTHNSQNKQNSYEMVYYLLQSNCLIIIRFSFVFNIIYLLFLIEYNMLYSDVSMCKYISCRFYFSQIIMSFPILIFIVKDLTSHGVIIIFKLYLRNNEKTLFKYGF